MRRPALAVLLLAVLVGLGWLAWRWIDPPPAEKTIGRRDAAAAAQPADPASADAAKVDAPVERTETTRLAPTPAEPPPVPVVPESYRRALSGVRGRVVEEDGTPVAGLEVELLELLGSSFLGDFERSFLPEPAGVPDVSIARTRTDAKGVFEIGGAIGHAFHALGVDLGGARGTVRFLDRTLTAGTTTDLGDIVLGPVVTWTGRVVDPDGVGVAGARVRATLFPPLVFQPGVIDVGRIVALIEVRDWSDSPIHVLDVPASVRAWESKLPFPTAITDDEGAFKLAGVPQGLATLVVDREGFTGAFRGPTPTGKRDRDVGAIELSRGRSVGGVVVDVEGRPIEGVEVIAGVVIEPARVAIGLPATSRTDASGAFVVPHLADQGGSLRVAARRNATDAWVSVTTDGSEAVRLVLPIGVEVTITTKDDSGAPVDGAELSLRAIGGPPFLTWQPPVAIDPSRLVALEPGRVALRGVTPGDYELLGRATGYGLAHSQLSVRTGPVAAELQFRRARDLDVLVVDRDTRAPIEYVELTVTATNERVRPPLLTRRSDVAGRARLSGVPLEPLRLHASHPAHAPSSLEVAVDAAAAGPIELVLGPGATIAGRVHQAGRPLAEPMLFLLEPRRDGASIDEEMPRFAVAGPDGRFELRGLPPGEARWQLMPRLFAGDPQETVQKIAGASAAFATARSGTVALKEGETAELDLDIDPAVANKPARVVGVIRSNEGDRFRIRLHVSGEAVAPEQSGNTIEVESGKDFTLEPVPPGWVNLMVESLGAPGGPGGKPGAAGTLHHEWFEITAGEEHRFELDLELVTGEALVLDSTGSPVPNIGVQFTLQKSESSRQSSMQSLYGMTGDDGIVRSELPRPGRYEVRCTDPQRGRAVAMTDVPSRKPVELRLERGVLCSGRIEVVPDLEGDAHAWLSIEDASRVDQGGSDFGWVQIEGSNRDFAIVGVPPGRYRARLFTNRGVNATNEFELGPNGDDHLVLKFTTQ